MGEKNELHNVHGKWICALLVFINISICCVVSCIWITNWYFSKANILAMYLCISFTADKQKKMMKYSAISAARIRFPRTFLTRQYYTTTYRILRSTFGERRQWNYWWFCFCVEKRTNWQKCSFTIFVRYRYYFCVFKNIQEIFSKGFSR